MKRYNNNKTPNDIAQKASSIIYTTKYTICNSRMECESCQYLRFVFIKSHIAFVMFLVSILCLLVFPSQFSAFDDDLCPDINHLRSVLDDLENYWHCHVATCYPFSFRRVAFLAISCQRKDLYWQSAQVLDFNCT